MPGNVSSTTSTKYPYVKVNIKDQQNGNSKCYEFPAGTVLCTTNTAYHLTKNGVIVSNMTRNNYNQPVYSDSRPLGGNTIPVILPQYIALDVLDVNQDQKFDDYDVIHSETFTQTDDGGVDVEESTANFEINERLERSNSVYYVPHNFGWGMGFDRENKSFDITFCDSREDNRYTYPNSKTLSIFLPKE